MLKLGLHWCFATVVHEYNSEWTCSMLMLAPQISYSGSADFSFWGRTSSESRVWVCWASFLKRGPGVFVVQPYWPDGRSLHSKSHSFVPADLLTECFGALLWFARHRRRQCFTRLLLSWSALHAALGLSGPHTDGGAPHCLQQRADFTFDLKMH